MAETPHVRFFPVWWSFETRGVAERTSFYDAQKSGSNAVLELPGRVVGVVEFPVDAAAAQQQQQQPSPPPPPPPPPAALSRLFYFSSLVAFEMFVFFRKIKSIRSLPTIFFQIF
jgi:hypothetical protein